VASGELPSGDKGCRYARHPAGPRPLPDQAVAPIRSALDLAVALVALAANDAEMRRVVLTRALRDFQAFARTAGTGQFAFPPAFQAFMDFWRQAMAATDRSSWDVNVEQLCRRFGMEENMYAVYRYYSMLSYPTFAFFPAPDA